MSAHVRMKGFHELTTVSIFLQRLFEAIPKTKGFEVETCKLLDALGRIAGEDITCPFDLPSFDRSAVDGYALRALSTIGASPTNPLEYKIVATIAAGDNPNNSVRIGEGETALIFTGAPVPEGADAVVMIENSNRLGELAQVRRQIYPMQNVSRKGEDFLKNEKIVSAGTIFRPWHIAAVASIGKGSVKVREIVRIGVLSTGSEIVEQGQPLLPGKVANSTKPMLLSFIREDHCQSVDLGTVPDDLEIIKRSVVEGLEVCDLVLTTGGSSVGERDLVQQAVSQIEGYRFIAHGVRLRPGRPTGAYMAKDKPIIVLSGFPVAAMAAYEAIVKPTIRHLAGGEDELRSRIRGVLKRRVSNETGNRSYVRVRVTNGANGLEVEPLMLTGSGLLSTLTKANGLLIIDEEIEGFDEGEEVEILLTGNVLPSSTLG